MYTSSKGIDYWASVHCTSVLIEKINKKRVLTNKMPSKGIVVEDEELSVAKSKKANIELFVKLMSNNSLRPLAKNLIEDMYKYEFDNSSSVDFNIENFDDNIKLKQLAAISLLEHSYGVFNIMKKIIDKKFGLYSDFFFIASLAHDSGKSHKLKEAIVIDLDISHHIASSQYLKKIVYQDNLISPYYKSLFEVVCDVFEAHHTKVSESLFYGVKKEEDNKELQILIMKYLKQADSKQRERELRMINDI
ncbi:HD domain-containing protein [Sulfurimonas sp.]|uniref:HD domain-containing protein n=1 Tax=Sulfurimonas sp. TaxID=2022749 RepID=UPI0025FB741A|nr:HD domain-containing protein [Sulfurimonas sp.]